MQAYPFGYHHTWLVSGTFTLEADGQATCPFALHRDCMIAFVVVVLTL